MRPQFDGTIVNFNSTAENPRPPRRLLFEHYKQAVLANMKGAGQPRDLEFDPSDDAHAMSTFESGEGKEWLEGRLLNKLGHLQDDNFDANTVVDEEKGICGQADRNLMPSIDSFEQDNLV
jgi:hypothetical protein